jgi:hypothetical protein
MSCCSGGRRSRRLESVAKRTPVRHRVHPESLRSVNDISEMIGKECIRCGVCDQSFALNDGQIVGSCVGCDRFLHCGIAGKCIGVDCSYIIRGVEQRATWCLDCVSMKDELNQRNNHIAGDCICKGCSKKRK